MRHSPFRCYRTFIFGLPAALVAWCIALGSSAHAATISSTWNGGINGDWSVNANWTPSSDHPNNDGGDIYDVSIEAATVQLSEDIGISALSLTDTTLGGADTLSVLGSLTLAGSNTFNAGLTVTVSSSFAFADLSASLANHGTLQFDTSSGYSTSAATLTNASDGTIRFAPAPAYGTSVGDSVTSPFSLVNHGTVLSDNGYNSVYAPITQSSSGLISVTSGSLTLSGGGTFAGTLRADGLSSSLLLYGYDKTYTLDGTAVTGTGSVSAYFTNLTGSLASGSLKVQNTGFTGSFVNESAATLLWQDFTRFSDASASLTNHGILQFDSSTGYFASTATLTNASDGVLRFAPAPAYGISVGDSVTSPFSLVNHGTVLSDNGYNSLYVPVTQSSSGLISVTSGSSLSLQGTFTQTAGEVRIENATLTSGLGQTLTFQGGLLRASGSISANLSLANTAFEIAAGETAGQLSLTGNLTLFTGSSIFFDLTGTTAGTGYDLLSVTGDVTLGGSLDIRLSSAFASTILATDEFNVLTAASIDGTFSNALSGERIMVSDGSGSFLVTITGTTLKLSGFSAIPEPATYGALVGLLALGCSLHRRRRRVHQDL